MEEHTFDAGRESGLMAAVANSSAGVEGARLARLGAVAVLDSTRAYEYDGFTSTSTFLVARCGLGVREANREVFLARSLGDLPYAVKLADKGDLTVSQLEVLAHAQNRHPDEFAADEPTLAEASINLSLADTRRLVAYWASAHDQGLPDDEEPSRVFLSSTWGGRGRLDGDLDAETRSLLATALDTLISELVRTTPKDELPSMSQLRAQALAELARRHLDSPDTPTDHGNRPHLTIVIDYETLLGNNPGGLSELADGTVISPATARRLACDANVCRLLTGPSGEILDLGRSRRTVSPAQWRALRIRDRHCTFPSCRRPWSWCDGHHIDSWHEADGPTDLDNLTSLCRHHHTLVHEGGWTLTGTPGNLVFTRPDGTTLPNAPP